MTRRDTRDALAAISSGEPESVASAVGSEEGVSGPVSLADTTVALVRIATLIALDAPPASYGRQVEIALDAGASPEDVLDVLRIVAPQVGGARVVAAAPELMLALGMSLPGSDDEDA